MRSVFPATDPFGSFARLLAAGLTSGIVASVPYAVARRAWIEPLLRQAETFETGGGAYSTELPLLSGWHGAFLTNAVAGTALGLLLAAAVTIRGRALDWRRGILWGLAGFTVFSLLPALTLPVGLPGFESAPLHVRQAWWGLSVLGGEAGLAVLVWKPGPFAKTAGVLLDLAAPIASALFWETAEPTPEVREIQLAFAGNWLAASAMFWIVIGGIQGLMARRISR